MLEHFLQRHARRRAWMCAQGWEDDVLVLIAVLVAEELQRSAALCFLRG